MVPSPDPVTVPFSVAVEASGRVTVHTTLPARLGAVVGGSPPAPLLSVTSTVNVNGSPTTAVVGPVTAVEVLRLLTGSVASAALLPLTTGVHAGQPV